MVKMSWKVRASVVVAGIAVAVQAVMAVDVKVDFEKTFDFKAVRTWAWNPETPGDVKMVRSELDDPDAMKQRAEPIIMKAAASIARTTRMPTTQGQRRRRPICPSSAS